MQTGLKTRAGGQSWKKEHRNMSTECPEGEAKHSGVSDVLCGWSFNNRDDGRDNCLEDLGATAPCCPLSSEVSSSLVPGWEDLAQSRRCRNQRPQNRLSTQTGLKNPRQVPDSRAGEGALLCPLAASSHRTRSDSVHPEWLKREAGLKSHRRATRAGCHTGCHTHLPWRGLFQTQDTGSLSRLPHPLLA